MIKYLFVLSLFLILFSCKKDEKDEVESKTQILKNCNPEYLIFFENVIYPPYSGKKNVFSYIYQNNKISRVLGGFIPGLSWSGSPIQVFSLSAEDSIVYSGDDVYLYQKIYAEKGIIEKNISPTIFTINQDNQLKKVIRINAAKTKVDEFVYSYSDNQIIEKDLDGRIYRIFLFENANLVKVTSQIKDSHGGIVSKDEIIFEGYDDKPNPFRNLFFISGAFYRAFSKNNYTIYTRNQYGIQYDGSFGLVSTHRNGLGINYNAENYPMFGDYE